MASSCWRNFGAFLIGRGNKRKLYQFLIYEECFLSFFSWRDSVTRFLPLSLSPVVHPELWLFPRIFWKNSKWRKRYNQGPWERMIHEKTLKSKVLWHCPFNILPLVKLPWCLWTGPGRLCSRCISSFWATGQVPCRVQMLNTVAEFINPWLGNISPFILLYSLCISCMIFLSEYAAASIDDIPCQSFRFSLHARSFATEYASSR